MEPNPLPPPAPPADLPPADCAAQLKERFPALFGGAFKPLKLRIQADIQERAPGVFSKQALSAFLRRHTGSTGYLVAMTRSPHRFDLDGQPAGDVSDEHRQAAADELARRRVNHQAKQQTTLTPANFCALKGIAPQALDALLATARREADERARQRPPPPLTRRRAPAPPR